MSFGIMKKKKFKFLVKLCIEELSSVPYVSGVLFAKIRLLDGGSFTKLSSKEEIQDHCIKWQMKCQFQCKTTANPSSAILDDCMCRVSIRKETKGGKSYQKLGYTDINLSEFAGSGPTTRRYLLNGYDAQHRQDNSMLKINLEMTLVSGDPCFKVPTSAQNQSDDMSDLHLPITNKGEDTASTPCSSINSESSGFNSLTRRDKHSDTVSEQHDFEPGHSRNSSEQSRTSMGYGSLKGKHSRQSSTGNDPLGHIRNPSSGSFTTEPWKSTAERRKKMADSDLKERRVDSTRIDADQLIEELVKGTDFKMDDSSANAGLQLIVNKDGTASLGGTHKFKDQSKHFQPVLFTNR